jgi:starvation-inducible DNA-binding protein
MINPSGVEFPGLGGEASAAAKRQAAAVLHQRLIELIDLQGQARQAHWAVRGPHFVQYHELFGGVVDAMDGPIDEVAERVGQLGGAVRATVREVAQCSTLAEYPVAAVAGPDHLRAMGAAIGAVANATRVAIDQVNGLGDAVSADLLTEVAGELDKRLWLVEAHLQSKT